MWLCPSPSPESLMPSLRSAGRLGRQEMLDVNGVELIRSVAEVTADFHLAALGEQCAQIVAPQSAQHVDDALTRAPASKEHWRRLEEADVTFREETSQDRSLAQRREFLGLERISQQLHAAPGVVDLLGARRRAWARRAVALLHRAHRKSLQQHAVRSRFFGMQPQPSGKLLRLVEVGLQTLRQARTG